MMIMALRCPSVFSCKYCINSLSKRKQKPSPTNQFVFHLFVLFFFLLLSSRFAVSPQPTDIPILFLPIFRWTTIIIIRFDHFGVLFSIHINKINVNDITLFGTQNNYVPPSFAFVLILFFYVVVCWLFSFFPILFIYRMQQKQQAKE